MVSANRCKFHSSEWFWLFYQPREGRGWRDYWSRIKWATGHCHGRRFRGIGGNGKIDRRYRTDSFFRKGFEEGQKMTALFSEWAG